MTQPSYVELGRQWDGSYLIKRVEALLRNDPSYTVTKPDGSKATEENKLATALAAIQKALSSGATVPGLTAEDIRAIVREELNKTKLTS